MRYMIIDIGSNTVKYDIYKVKKNTFSLVSHNSYPARLITRIENGTISEEGKALLTDLLQCYKKEGEALNCTQISAFATASFRKISEPAVILEALQKSTGIKVRLLSGEEESALSFKGMFIRQPALPSSGLMLDMGGGSTEINLFEQRLSRYLHSCPFGAGVIKSAFSIGDSLTDANEQQVRAMVDDLLPIESTMYPALSKQALLIGGTVRACRKLGKVLCGIPCIDGKMTIEEFHRIYEILKDPAPENDLKIKEICPDRYQLMASGLCALIRIFERMGTEQLYICSGGIREGYLSEMLGKDDLIYKK